LVVVPPAQYHDDDSALAEGTADTDRGATGVVAEVGGAAFRSNTAAPTSTATTAVNGSHRLSWLAACRPRRGGETGVLGSDDAVVDLTSTLWRS
jgi:hypothetical protein